jgi:hypothetical protein
MELVRITALEARRTAMEAVREVEQMATVVQHKVPFISRAVGVAMDHPFTTSIAAVAASIVSVLQSAQSVVSTLVSLASSITALVLGVMAIRGAFRKAKKGEDVAP